MKKVKLITLFLLSINIYGCFNRPTEKTGLEGNTMPSFDLLLEDSITNLNTANIPSGKPIVLFFFGPYCPYSRVQMESIVTNIKSLTNIQFYIFTRSPFKDMKLFSTYYQLRKYKNIAVGIDYTNYFGSYFKTPGVPYTAIYDTKKRLKQVLIGKSSAALIKDIAEE
jgi:thiol-disulfide isomerase/thioredoxin